MERLLRWLDECDDLLAMLRVQARPIIISLVLLIAFLAIVGAIFAVGAPDLLASP